MTKVIPTRSGILARCASMWSARCARLQYDAWVREMASVQATIDECAERRAELKRMIRGAK